MANIRFLDQVPIASFQGQGGNSGESGQSGSSGSAGSSGSTGSSGGSGSSGSSGSAGSSGSMGSFLSQAGTAGKRIVLPESRTMIHRVSSGTRGTSGSVYVQELQFEDAVRSMEESKKVNRRLTELYVKHNTAGKTYEEMSETMKFDTFLTAHEAVEWGLADKVMENR